jgi:tetratricopeptide (TPR) repeat protein
LKAAALLHTDVATASLLRGDHERAAVHRAIAGWLLWHLPQDAQDDAFVREWVLAVNSLLLGDGSLSSARQLGQLGLLRFPNDAALLLSAARANEALATLCYAPEGNPFGGDDCDDTPIAFDMPQPARPLPGNRQSLKQGDVVRETERLLRALAKELPADPEVHLRLGRVLAERARLDEAERELALVVTSSRDTNQVALAHLLLGRLAEARNDAQAALEHARAARTLAPRSQSARMALASALLASGERQGAAQLMADLPTTPNGVDDPWAEFLQGSMLRFVPARAALYGRVKLP